MAGTPARKRRRILDSESSSPGRHQGAEDEEDIELDEAAQQQRRLDKGKQREVILDEDAEAEDVDGEAEPDEDGQVIQNNAEDEDETMQQRANGEGVDGQEQNDEDDEMDPELAEKWRIWDMFTEEFHDITAELPGELHRNLQLMLEYDQQVKNAERELEQTLREYAIISNSGSYKSAIANAAKAQRTAASASQSLPPAQVAVSNGSMRLQALMNPEPVGENLEDGRAGSSTSDEDVRAALLPDTARESAMREAEAAEKLKKMLNDISKQMQITIRTGEDKVALAVTAYNWVDRHIQRLDSDLLKMEDSLSLGLRAGTMPSGDAQEAQTHAKENTTLAALIDGAGVPGGGKADQSMSTDTQPSAVAANANVAAQDAQTSAASQVPKRPANNRRKSGKKDRKIKASSQVPPAGFITIPPDVEVNPLDPKYCYCNQVSYGEMLGCENEDCPREWFHLQCVGLTVAPKGKWWCRDCIAEKGRAKSSTR